MNRCLCTKTVISVAAAAVVFFCSTAFAGNTDSIGKWAWGENAGWLNFGVPAGDVTVTDVAVIGFVWAENIGWISLSPEDFGGITRDGTEKLSGWAWGENVGWINFRGECDNGDEYGVSINDEGLFSGRAWSESVGWINFNLDAPLDIYTVRTCPDVNQDGECDDVAAQCGNGQIEDGETCEDNSDCDDGFRCFNCNCSSVTFAEEINFNAVSGSGMVTLAWTAVSETDVLGYNILRKVRYGGAWVQINDSMIQGKGSIETTVSYEFVDDGVQNRRTYQYKLVEVEIDGAIKNHGPLNVTPRLIYYLIK